ncbi:MAG: hypothetical protein EZS28_025014 [Streblomastix strix]|uniref:Uncharacterized protein n=1 Tax=Streblomastix strix TaxID=222440 RepID=A0A5J4VA48_9EUKA|nr:MAG: hypothetical protein EZS28_025014 [Streblomastix strix]
MKGLFDEPMLITGDIMFTLTGSGHHATSICNTKQSENSILWIQQGANILIQDCTLFRYSMTSPSAFIFDCDSDSNIIVKRCVLCNDQTAQKEDQFSAGIIWGVLTSGGFYDCIIYNSQMTDQPSIIFDGGVDDFDFDLIEINEGKCRFKPEGEGKPQNNPIPVLIIVTFDMCLFEDSSFINIQLNRSYFDIELEQINLVSFKHCIWNSNGKIWNSDSQTYDSEILESGALVLQYAYYPDNLKYTINSEECNINTGNVVVDSCVFMDNVGIITDDVLIEEDLLNFTITSPNRNMIIDSTSTFIGGELTQFVAMMIKYDPGYNIQFKTGIAVEETTLNVKYNKLSIFKDDNVQEEVIFITQQTPTSPNFLLFIENGAFIDPYSSSLIAVEQSGEISMKSIVILHFYEKTLNSVIQVKDEAKFNGIQLIFRPIKEQFSGMATLPTTEQISPYLLCIGGFTILESCQFLPTNFMNSAAIRTKYEIGINSKEGAQSDDYSLTLKGCQMIGMNRIDEAENSGSAIDAHGMKITLESCLFDMNTQQSNITKNKINKTIKRNEDEQIPEHLIPTCGWHTGYIRQNTGILILSKGTQLTHLNKGAISLLGANLTISDADVQFLNNIDTDLLQGLQINDDEDEPIIIKPTFLRRNIACGYGSRITSPIESFTENGLQEDSLWILKTLEGKKIENEQQDNVYESECQLSGEIESVKDSLFIPHIDEASGIMSQDKLGLDITLIGRHLVRCGVVKYKVCEKMKVTNDDGQEIEEKVKERELHCQTDLMENAIYWENETQFTIQTRYLIVRKWKTMEVWLIFSDGSQISEVLSITIGKLSTGAIVAVVVTCIILASIALIALIVVLCYEYKQKQKIERLRLIEEESEVLSGNAQE